MVERLDGRPEIQGSGSLRIGIPMSPSSAGDDMTENITENITEMIVNSRAI